MTTLNIPQSDRAKFAYFIGLDQKDKIKIFEALQTAEGLTRQSITNHLSVSIGSSIENISDIMIVYTNLMDAKNKFDEPIDVFIKLLENALSEIGQKEFTPTEEILYDFYKLLTINNAYSNTIKARQMMSDNERTFLDAKIYQNIRPAFNETEDIGMTSIIHNLKLIVNEDREIKEINIALDGNDIDMLIKKLKKAQERAESITNYFSNALFVK